MAGNEQLEQPQPNQKATTDSSRLTAEAYTPSDRVSTTGTTSTSSTDQCEGKNQNTKSVETILGGNDNPFTITGLDDSSPESPDPSREQDGGMKKSDRAGAYVAEYGGETKSPETKSPTDRAETKESTSTKTEDIKTVKFGKSELSFGKDNDGKEFIAGMKLPGGTEITRGPDGKYTDSKGNKIDSIGFNKEAKGFEIRWGEKNGNQETSHVRSSGIESTFKNPTKLFGVDNVKSAEYITGRDGKNTLSLRTADGAFHKFPIKPESGERMAPDLKKGTTIPKPADLTEGNAHLGAKAVQDMIDRKYNGSFGTAADQKYIKDVYDQYQKLGKTDFVKDVNQGNKDARYKMDELSIRSGDSSLMIRDTRAKKEQLPKPIWT